MSHQITDLTADYAEINGTRALHRDILLACSQDDLVLMVEYRAIAEQILPLVEERCDVAYERYVNGPTKRTGGTVAGHGSFSSGPDPVTQAAWEYWTRLRDDYRRAIRGEYRPIPDSRRDGGDR